MDCPRCGAEGVTTPDCPACGVLLAKARPARPRTARPEPEPPAAWRSLVLPALGLALLAGAAVVHLRRTPASEPPRPRTAATQAPAPAAPALPPAPRRDARPAAPPPLALPPATAANPALEADQAAANRLVERLKAGAAPSADDVRSAEELYSRYPHEARSLLEAVLLAAAQRDVDARRFDSAAAFAERATSVAPQSPASRRALLDVRLAAADWVAAEAAGHALVALSPDDPAGVRGLAYALVRQDRTREAIALLTEYLGRHDDPEARALLGRVQHDQAAERSLDEARLAHFHVRYDGDAHEDVGREILRLAERHYATLVRTFDYQPSQPIPVILLSSESYYDTTGAPAWSGGQYDSFDGRVRIPIGGLSAALAPELDGTLIHEITHSFVADRSRGLAPRELHEGLAQYMEGRRIAQLDAARLRALAGGRLRGVSGFYLGSLHLVEDLLGQRGQGGINDLLKAMAATGSADEAFRQVYGRDFRSLQRQAAEKLNRQY